MKKLLALSLGLVLSVSSFTANAANYDVDVSHSSVGFTIRHMVGKVTGSFGDFSGSFSFDEKNPGAAKGEFVAKATSVNTANADRDKHLRNADFFNVEKFPDIKIKIKKLNMTGNKGKLETDFTMLGVTKPVTFDVEYGGVATNPWGKEVIGVSATSVINRKDFGMIWNKGLDKGGFLLGDEVTLNLQVEGVKK